MKKCWLLFFVTCCTSISFAQNVAINNDGSGPDASAMLDIKSTERGLLIPRMTEAQRIVITSPATGLMVYQTNNTVGYWYYNGSAWVSFQSLLSGWGLAGNNGTNPATNFLGTGDAQPLKLRANNIAAGELNPSNSNSAWGLRALSQNTTGYSNVALGSGALLNNTSGFNIVAVGDSALFSQVVDPSGTYQNSAVGSKALFSNSTGFNNTGIGYQSMFSNTIGSYNSSLGKQSLFSNTTGQANTALGTDALYSNTTGSDNTAVGTGSLFDNNNGRFNTAVGRISLASNISGNNNSAFGNSALNSNTTGYSNVAVGVGALITNTEGHNLVAVGDSALYNQTIGSPEIGAPRYQNTAVGSKALFSNIAGSINTAIGYHAMYSNTTGYVNSAFGHRAMFRNTTGTSNVAIGHEALYQNLGGDNNTAVGAAALNGNVTGSNNVAIGYLANTFGASNNAVAIGWGAAAISNQVRLGNSLVTSIEAQVGLTVVSDGRYKYNVRQDVKGLEFIMQLRPVTYQFDVKRFDPGLRQQNTKPFSARENQILETSWQEAAAIRRTGFIAQEVEKAAVSANFEFSGINKPKSRGGHYGLSYEAFVVPLVKAVQEQQAIILDLKSENRLLSEKYELLLRRLEALEKK